MSGGIGSTIDTTSCDMVGIIQAIVRQEMKRIRVAEIGIVTSVFSHESGSDDNNYECDVRLRDSGLELQRVPVATQRIGMVAIPNIDDMVLVQFVSGDLHGAVITGRLYNNVDRPPEANDKECVYESRDDAESGVRRIYLKLPNGNSMLVDDDKIYLELGDTNMTINNSGDVDITSSAKITLTSAGDTEIQSDGDLKLSASGDIKIEAGGAMDLKAGTDLKGEALSVSMKADTSLDIEGSASLSVKGGVVDISGMISFSS